jgi:hypothetical protein
VVTSFSNYIYLVITGNRVYICVYVYDNQVYICVCGNQIYRCVCVCVCVLWNPSIQKAISLLEPNLPFPSSLNQFVGFGYEPMIDDFNKK